MVTPASGTLLAQLIVTGASRQEALQRANSPAQAKEQLKQAADAALALSGQLWRRRAGDGEKDRAACGVHRSEPVDTSSAPG